MLCHGRKLLTDIVQQPPELRVDRLCVGLVIDAVQHRLHRWPHALRRHCHEVCGVVGAAPLPGRPGKVRSDCFDQPRMRITGDQADPGETAGDEVGEEAVPRSSGLTGRDPHAEHFAVPVTVDAGREQDDGIDHAATFTDLHGQRVGGDEREGAGLVQGAVAELLDVLVQRLRHPADLRLRQTVDTQGLHELIHPAGGDTGEIAVRDDRDQGGFGALAALEQPLGEVGAGAGFGTATSIVPTRVSRSRWR